MVKERIRILSFEAVPKEGGRPQPKKSSKSKVSADRRFIFSLKIGKQVVLHF